MYPKAYIDYLVYFHGDRDYFECHEVLEEYWKQTDNDIVWVGFIQIAVGLYHHRRGNFKGAQKMIANAIAILEAQKDTVEKLGINQKTLLTTLQTQLNAIIANEPYISINLPIQDESLLTTCKNACNEKDLTWEKNSDLTNNFLINKHTLRDRTEVIKERANQLAKRKKKNRGSF
ncbi:DUF309 domain-containing protein [Bacillus sp. SM2101]|uniref:DUF309 domain-containing protein n=1 Tax=Bacillus sp. SM2101 TaxID=2805366 RepID=UPI001BDEB286|nr:DUF309 domain-containing protein [Bacillus sp. SM2101]